LLPGQFLETFSIKAFFDFSQPYVQMADTWGMTRKNTPSPIGDVVARFASKTTSSYGSSPPELSKNDSGFVRRLIGYTQRAKCTIIEVEYKYLIALSIIAVACGNSGDTNEQGRTGGIGGRSNVVDASDDQAGAQAGAAGTESACNRIGYCAESP
jgi:hypothetical protein